ncbi:ATPase, T2SS/T4P/T4SS family [Chromobacterium haemolyticum]|uniref:ATPase, T2SS/T4P/T4SS family n=1 Tax=Chromobacterium haemolyticum TaxID=394935 RepID=UPI00244856A4|nr:ATPase, T2SS/T4P/T4SS family [Chromobacterium haemolyticum]MDH0341960.1 GspE family protein [Chromobacterium haemolyticum]
MKTPRISQIDFVDLYIGEDYCDIKGLAGASAPRVLAPAELADQIADLREKCKEIYRAQEEPEFSLILDGVLLRVTQISDVTNGDVFILRRSPAQIRPFTSLGLAPHVMKAVLDKDLRGLILIAGEMGAGKTSTAASLVVQRLALHGGIAIAVEDPPETPLNGVHGNGRCIQIRASRKSGGYSEHMTRAMRSGADLMLIGEIRNDDTAYQAATSGINGLPIVTTIHAGDPVEAVERLHTYCSSKTPNANNIIADGLAAVIWQSLEKVPRQGESGTSARLVSQALILTGPDADGIRAKIRKGLISQIRQDVENQNRLAVWNMQRVLGDAKP